MLRWSKSILDAGSSREESEPCLIPLTEAAFVMCYAEQHMLPSKAEGGTMPNPAFTRKAERYNIWECKKIDSRHSANVHPMAYRIYTLVMVMLGSFLSMICKVQ